MTHRAFLLAGIAAMFAVPAGAAVSDFRLPVPTPTPTPRAQGPVDPSLPPPRVATPTPSPTPAPTPTITVPVLPDPSPTPTPAPRSTATRPAPAATPTPSAPIAAPEAEPTGEATPAPLPLPQTVPAAPPAPAAVSADEGDEGSSWPWVAGLLLLVGALAAFLWVRRRVGPTGPVAVPEIERPRVPARPQAAAEPEPAPSPAPLPPVRQAPEPAPAGEPLPAAPHPLHISIEPGKLSLTLMNATLSYRLTLTNRGAEPLEDLVVSADLIGAHAALSREEQLAGPLTELAERHRLAGLAPDESGEVSGQLRLPLAMVRPIVQGKAALFVPLARFRVAARGQEPRCFTVVVGQPSPRNEATIQPVRLDLGPRIYDGLAGRAF
ncbi:hypothetical protein [Croceibacterium soli]|uniref:hypothetical protein n=1 Tax=Croceibacterium soli TaxID=1739690 RepID=UPI001928F207|nr:hypothetical protein [Croceibacterium soli]